MFNDMIQRMLIEVPGVTSSQAKTLLNDALGLIYDSQYWSWQIKENGWLTPGLLFPSGPGTSTGTITAVPYTPTVTGNAVSSAAWAAYIAGANLPLFTQLQIRSPYYSLYNIISVNQSNPSAIVLTLDRPWMEPGGVLSYMIYQAYFPVPVSDFKRFLTARDTTNNAPMNFWQYSQKDLSRIDPERTIFDTPGYIIPYEVDQRPGSATLGSMLYELWPHPVSVLPYTYSYLRRGPLLVNPTDTVPYPLTEECLNWRAKEVAYLFKEAQKGEHMDRGHGANWQFLAESAREEYKTALKPIRERDRDLYELYFNRISPDLWNAGQPFSNQNGTLNVGQMV